MFSIDIGKSHKEMVLEIFYRVNLLVGTVVEGVYYAIPVYPHLGYSLHYHCQHQAGPTEKLEWYLEHFNAKATQVTKVLEGGLLMTLMA